MGPRVTAGWQATADGSRHRPEARESVAGAGNATPALHPKAHRYAEHLVRAASVGATTGTRDADSKR
jgi:hypothetical protein